MHSQGNFCEAVVKGLAVALSACLFPPDCKGLRPTQDMVRFRLETPRAKPPPDASSVRPSSAAASASPAPAAAVPAPPAAASQAPSDPRRPVSGQAPGQAGQSSGQSSGQQPSKPGQLPQAQPVVIPVDPRKAAAAAKTTVIGADCAPAQVHAWYSTNNTCI